MRKWIFTKRKKIKKNIKKFYFWIVKFINLKMYRKIVETIKKVIYLNIQQVNLYWGLIQAFFFFYFSSFECLLKSDLIFKEGFFSRNQQSNYDENFPQPCTHTHTQQLHTKKQWTNNKIHWRAMIIYFFNLSFEITTF